MSTGRIAERDFPRFHGPRHLMLTAFVAIAAGIFVLPSALRAQEVTAPPSEEIVANLAAGRVIVAVVKDAIIIATVENPIESQTHPPIPVELNSPRPAALFGGGVWFSPRHDQPFARLDRGLDQE